MDGCIHGVMFDAVSVGCGKSNNAGGETSVLDGGAGKRYGVVLLDVC